MSSSFEALPAGDSAEEDPDHSLENARESLLNTVSDLALSTGVYQNAYTSQVLLSISQLLRILATNPASETPDLELGELPPPEDTSRRVRFAAKEEYAPDPPYEEDNVQVPPVDDGSNSTQVVSNETAKSEQEQSTLEIDDPAEKDDPEEPEWLYDFRTKYCDKEFEFLAKRGFFVRDNFNEWPDGEPPENALENAPEMVIRSSIPEDDLDEWILSPEFRADIYSALFIPTNDPSRVFPEPVFRDIVLGKVNIVKKLQGFILQTYKIECEPHLVREEKQPGRRDLGSLHETVSLIDGPISENELPNLLYFVDDIVEMVSCLKKVIKKLDDVNAVDAARWSFEMDRKWSWGRRWRNLPDWDPKGGEERWLSYSCALRDALFGLWPAKGKDEYHSGEWDECITETLDTIDTSPNYQPNDLREGDLRILDASYIETHGPFRFLPTHTIDDHLLITQNRYIHIYVDWRTLGAIRHHSVLTKRKDKCTVFDVIMKRPRVNESVRPFLFSLHHHIQISIMLLFFQDATTPGWKASQPSSILQSILSRFTRHRTSLGILRNLERDVGTRTTQEEMNKRGQIYVETIKGWPLMVRRDSEFRCLFAFRERMDELVEKLQAWKPETFWELRYSGYGGVDGVGLWGYYVALILGGVTIVVTIAAAVLQTYTGFKALQQGNGQQGNGA